MFCFESWRERNMRKGKVKSRGCVISGESKKMGGWSRGSIEDDNNNNNNCYLIQQQLIAGAGQSLQQNLGNLPHLSKLLNEVNEKLPNLPSQPNPPPHLHWCSCTRKCVHSIQQGALGGKGDLNYVSQAQWVSLVISLVHFWGEKEGKEAAARGVRSETRYYCQSTIHCSLPAFVPREIFSLPAPFRIYLMHT